MQNQKISRRKLLILTANSALAGGCAASRIRRVQGISGCTECVDIPLDGIKPGDILSTTWDKKPIIIRRRSAAEIREVRGVALTELPDPAADAARTIRPEWLVVVNECPHGGCKLIDKLGGYGGWLCPCHGSVFDVAGRIRSGPALTNLPVPPYYFVSDKLLRIGIAE